jgi:hopanoid biosynthesis associated RND transporter like protein HpnN
LLVGLSGTASFAAAAVGHLNLLSVAFAVLYVGLGVDFILHLCLRLDELRRQGRPLEASLVESARGVGSSLVICAITTATGFYSFIPTPFEGVSELGLISGTGMFVSLVVSLTFLPAMLAVFAPRKIGARPATVAGAERAARAVSTHPRTVAAACALAAAVTFLGLPAVSFDSNPIHLRDPTSESIVAIEELAAASEAPLLNVIALAEDRATAERWQESLSAVPLVREVRTIDTLVPAEQADKQFVLEDIGLVLGSGFGDIEALDPDPAGLRAALAELEGALADKGELTSAETQLQTAVVGLLERDAGEAELRTLDANLRSDLSEQLAELETGLQATPFGRADLPPELAGRWTSARDEQLIEIVPSENVNDNEAAERFVDAVRAVVPSATGLPVVHREASATVVYSFRLALTYALVMVAALLFVFLRRIVDVLLVIGPIVVAAAATAGVSALLGMPFNFANIIALPLLVGVGVDNGIHIVHRAHMETSSRGDALGTSTSRAVFASGITTIASFGNLAFSPHVGMASMGMLLTLGMVVTMVATLLLLPALLALRARR